MKEITVTTFGGVAQVITVADDDPRVQPDPKGAGK